MRRLTLLGLVGAALVVFAVSSLNAQERPSKVVYLNSQAAILAHPAGADMEALRAQVASDVDELVAGLNALEEKAASGAQLSVDETDRYRTLQTTLMAVEERYRTDMDEVAGPAKAAVDAAIAELAAENGYTIVMDSVSAAESGLIVYADPSLDITPLVIERVQAQ